MSKITDISGRKIIDSRGEPTVEVKVVTDGGFVGIDSVPSGTSTGKKEAALVDVDVACANINQVIAPALIGQEVEEQDLIDKKMIELDGTENKSRLGANAILGVSLAVCRAAAMQTKTPLYSYINKLFNKMSGLEIEPKIPTPMMVMLCGGAHVKGIEHSLCTQEFSVIGSMEDGIAIWHSLEKILKAKGVHYVMGLEGAFAPELENDEKALEILNEAIGRAENLKGEIRIGLDVAGNNCRMTNIQVIDLFKKYNLFSIEDPFGEEDWVRFGQLKLELEELKKPFLLIGDDLFATHKALLEKGVTQLVGNGIIIKPNQVGTLTETLEVIGIATKANFDCVVSHRSGETIDSFIADLAVGVNAKFLKSGAPIPNERLMKYKRLKEIAQNL
ncbi:MAG: phosphopyruvate hydratase [Patescibacteria group bacterium]